jgi:tRNA dimethylallyltransferase
MGSKPNNTPVIAIVGETASGKTALAIQLAKQFGGEIICADSRTVYRGMDIGAAKPSTLEQDGVPHHVLDVVNPDESFSAADFQRLANEAIADIAARGHIPFIVGGTGLYVDAVLYDFQFRPAPDPQERQRLQALTIQELQTEILERGLVMPQNSQNPRHLTRVLEAGDAHTQHTSLRPNTLMLGLTIERDVLKAKLTKRVEVMCSNGFEDEVRILFVKYGPETPALQAPGYKAFKAYLDGQCSLEEAKELFVRNDYQLAKRQRTWFKRNKSIHWVAEQAEAVDLVTTFLNK